MYTPSKDDLCLIQYYKRQSKTRASPEPGSSPTHLQQKVEILTSFVLLYSWHLTKQLWITDSAPLVKSITSCRQVPIYVAVLSTWLWKLLSWVGVSVKEASLTVCGFFHFIHSIKTILSIESNVMWKTHGTWGYPRVATFHSDSSFLCHRVGHLCSWLCLFCLRQSICRHLSSSTNMTALSFYKLNSHL